MKPVLLLASVSMVFTACFYPADRGRALEARIDRLTEENQAQSDRLRSSQQKLQEQMTQAVESLERGSRRSDADIGVQLQKTLEDLAQLRGQVETYLHKLSELETQLKQGQEDNDKRMNELKGSDAVKAAEAKRRAEELQRPTDKKEFLAFAQQKAAGDPVLGRTLYAEFIKKWPRDELLGEAHFGLGESFYGEDKCREALAEFGKVIQEYPKAKSAPTALLRSSDCFSQLKMAEESKLALQELVRGYPKSEAAGKARAKLAELNKKKPAPKAKK